MERVNRSRLFVPAVALLLVSSRVARADDAPPRVAAFELTGHVAYVGAVPLASEARDAAPGSGLSFATAAGFRWAPEWSALLGLDYSLGFPAPGMPADSLARSKTLEARGVYLVGAGAPVDPWVSIGVGFRLLWQSSPDDATRRADEGVEPAIVMFGVDLRVSPNVAIGPFAGAALTVFTAHTREGDVARASPDPATAVFFDAGLQLRFDVPFSSMR